MNPRARALTSNRFFWFALPFFLLVPTSAQAALSARAEVNPNPAQPGETVDMQITVSSTSASGSLVLRLLWPAAMNFQSPSTTGGGACPGSCDTGEFLTWNLGSLGSGSSITVGFADQLKTSLVDGTVIPFQVELLEGGVSRLTFTKNIEVRPDSPLELTIDPLLDPVPTSGAFEYELVYGNLGASPAENCELGMTLPAGTQFLAATGNGLLVGNRVIWDCGSLTANSGGRERVKVNVGALAASTLLAVDDAAVTAEVQFLPKIARAEAVTRVASQPIQVNMELNPDPLTTGELIDGQITVSNPTNQSTGSLLLRLWWPEELDFQSPTTTGGGACPGSCNAGETLVWTLGSLPPFSSRVVSFGEDAQNLADGRLLPFELELLEGNLAARSLSHTLIQRSASPLELTVDPLSDPVAPGGYLTYEVSYANSGNAVATGAILRFPVPAGTTLVTPGEGGVFTSGLVTFDLGDIAPGRGGRRRVSFQAPNAPAGSQLRVDAAELSANINFLESNARAMAVSRIGTTTVEALVEIQADPVAPGELIDAQIAIVNRGASPTGSLSLRMLWPTELDFGSPQTTGGGACPGSCNQGEYVFWSIGVLGAGASQIVSVNQDPNSWPDGTLIPFEIELLDASGAPLSTLSRTLIMKASSPLELAIDPRTDPAPAGSQFVYDITYGNAGNTVAQDAVLSFPIPPASTYVSNTGDGRFSGGKVIWRLGNLAANQGGRVQVTVLVPAGVALLESDDARLEATLNTFRDSTRAAAVSRVAVVNRNLTMTTTPNPIDGGQFINGQFTISNPTGSATGALTLRLLWPDELDFESPTTSGGGACPGSCNQGEYLSWNLGILGGGASVNVGFSQDIGSLARGTLIPFEAELIEANFPARTRSQTLLVQTFADNDNDGEANALDPDDDNDGMPDTWEVLYSFNPLNAADAGQDPDFDGLSNLAEFRLGSHPRVSDYLFADGFENGNTSRWN